MLGFDELICCCGVEVMLLLIFCGMKFLECDKFCFRIYVCLYLVYYFCYSEDDCFFCFYLIKKKCMGDYEFCYNILCYVKYIFCGKVCGKLLLCGYKCLRICYKLFCLGLEEFCV